MRLEGAAAIRFPNPVKFLPNPLSSPDFVRNGGGPGGSLEREGTTEWEETFK